MTHEAAAATEGAPSHPVAFAATVAVVLVLLTVPRLLLHELWRDEAWQWLVAVESETPTQFLGELNRTGRGYLFPLLCWLAARVWSAPQAMQLLSLVVFGASAYVLARWSPFRRAECVLLLLGYHFFYEYAIVSPHYGLGVLLTFLACVAVRRASPLGLGMALALLCQTTVYGYIIAIAIAAGFLFERWARRTIGRPLPRSEVLAGAVLALAGAIAGLVQLMPEADSTFAVAWRFNWDVPAVVQTLKVPWRAFVPLPATTVQWWESDLLIAWPQVRAFASVAILLLAAALLWPRRVALLVFVIGGFGILLFCYVKYFGFMRHHGNFWLLFVAALWLAGGVGGDARRRGLRDFAFLGLLIAQAGAAAIASVGDLRRPFSNGPATAQLIRARGLERFPLLGYRETAAASVTLPLGRPLYAPSRQFYTTHPTWVPQQRDLWPPELRCSARAFALREQSDIVLVVSVPLPPWPELHAVAATSGAIVWTEDYALYRMRLDALPATAAEAACP